MRTILVKLLTMIFEAIQAAHKPTVLRRQLTEFSFAYNEEADHDFATCTLYENGIVDLELEDGSILTTHISRVDLAWLSPSLKDNETEYDMDNTVVIESLPSNVIQFRPRAKRTGEFNGGGAA